MNLLSRRNMIGSLAAGTAMANIPSALTASAPTPGAKSTSDSDLPLSSSMLNYIGKQLAVTVVGAQEGSLSIPQLKQRAALIQMAADHITETGIDTHIATAIASITPAQFASYKPSASPTLLQWMQAADPSATSVQVPVLPMPQGAALNASMARLSNGGLSGLLLTHADTHIANAIGPRVQAVSLPFGARYDAEPYGRVAPRLRRACITKQQLCDDMDHAAKDTALIGALVTLLCWAGDIASSGAITAFCVAVTDGAGQAAVAVALAAALKAVCGESWV